MRVKIGIVQAEVIDWDIDTTTKIAVKYLRQFQGKNRDIIVFPESYPGRYESLKNHIKKLGLNSWLIIGEHVEIKGKKYNSATLIDRSGEVFGRQFKNNLFPSEIKRGISPGEGFDVFKTDFGTIGMLVCHDFPTNPEATTILVLKGAEIIFVISLAVKSLLEHWRLLLLSRSIDNGVPIVFVNIGGARTDEYGFEFGGGRSKIVIPITYDIEGLDDLVRSRITPNDLVFFEMDENPGVAVVELDIGHFKKYRGDIFKCRKYAKKLLK